MFRGNSRSGVLFVQKRMSVFPLQEFIRTSDFCKLSVLLQAILKSCPFPGTTDTFVRESSFGLRKYGVYISPFVLMPLWRGVQLSGALFCSSGWPAFHCESSDWH